MTTKRGLLRGAWAAACAALLLALPLPVQALALSLAGVFGNRAVLVVEGGAPQTVAQGRSTREGVQVLEVGSDWALVDVHGRRERLELGRAPVQVEGAARESVGGDTLVLVPDSQGHYYAGGSINGATVRFLLDTGATMVSMGRSDARRAGVSLQGAQRVRAQTANGVVTVWQVRLDSVRVGDLVLHGVDGLVHEADMPQVLLGMSFLQRMDMERQGGHLLLRKRF